MTIHRTSIVPVTNKCSIVVYWKADDNGFTIDGMQIKTWIKLKQGIYTSRGKYPVSKLNDNKIEKVHGFIRESINFENNRSNVKYGDLPKMIPITNRAVTLGDIL